MRNRAATPLSKAKVRQSWNKYNLYNLSRVTNPPYKTRSFFQQKWSAKSVLRAYHGEQVREGQWVRMFTRRLKSVVPMNAEYLAINDGQVESAGRGSGVERERPRARPDPIPYMQMTFAPLERRLDTAIFRSMFASSARQARQFVVHGGVKVNGKKMKYPGYLLNPGDMFQVDPERVMFATGAPKAPSETTSEDVDAKEEAEPTAEVPEAAPEEEVEDTREAREVLRDLLSQSKSIISSQREKLGAKRKQDLRAFSASVKRVLSRSKSSTILTDSLEAQFAELQNQLRIQRQKKESGQASLPSEQLKKTVENESPDQPVAEGATSKSAETTATSTSQPETTEIASQPVEDESTTLSDREYNELFAALSEMAENPIDDSKPYATPWMPRDYMSAFAFIPRYLEVNPAICAAVYLRHPVARPGLAEVPTPFAETTGGGAFAWYLRRR